MVTSNRSNESGSPHWWDDLPPHMRARFEQPLVHEAEPAAEAEAWTAEPLPPPSRGELVGDLSRLAAAFVLATLGILLYLLVAVTYVTG